MSAELKKRLQELATKKRKENPKPKDFDRADWGAAADWAMEQPECGGEPAQIEVGHRFKVYEPSRQFLKGVRVAYCRYVPQEFVEVLCRVLPHYKKRWKMGPGRSKEYSLFDPPTLLKVMEFLGLDPDKYVRLIMG